MGQLAAEAFGFHKALVVDRVIDVLAGPPGEYKAFAAQDGQVLRDDRLLQVEALVELRHGNAAIEVHVLQHLHAQVVVDGPDSVDGFAEQDGLYLEGLGSSGRHNGGFNWGQNGTVMIEFQ